MMDIITLDEIEVKTLIGVYDYEQQMPQKLIISLAFGLKNLKAQESDALNDTVDYAKVHQTVLYFAEKEHHQLLERFANTLSDTLISEFNLPWLKMTVKKPAALR